MENSQPTPPIVISLGTGIILREHIDDFDQSRLHFFSMVNPEYMPSGLQGEPYFRWRGGEVSRIEGLSDAVFALSLTLLVVALEVPSSSGELIAVFWQFPAFAFCFAFILWVWYEHYIYHRRYGFEDGVTVALNGLLLFFIVFYVFPLRFLASALVTGPLTGDRSVQSMGQGTTVMLFYSGGFVAIFTVLALMYWRAWRLRDRIQLDLLERIATWGAVRRHLLSIAVGLGSIVLAVAVPQHPAWSGMIYFLMGPVQGISGYLTGKELERAMEAGTEDKET